MQITLLGTGTSTGVPIPTCKCEVCTSTEPKNKRLRCSVYLKFNCAEDKCSEPFGLLIDTTPDLRCQALKHQIEDIKAVLYTHYHADHIFGLDDLRPFSFSSNHHISAYASEATVKELQRKFDYAFSDKKVEGGSPPRIQLHTIDSISSLSINGINIQPLPAFHGSMPVLGFRIKDFAYLTDCSMLPEETRKLMQDLKVLVIDGLRERPHKTHFNHQQAIAEIEKLRPQKSYLTHITHEADHNQTNLKLKQMTKQNVSLAYDGLEFNL